MPSWVPRSGRHSRLFCNGGASAPVRIPVVERSAVSWRGAASGLRAGRVANACADSRGVPKVWSAWVPSPVCREVQWYAPGMLMFICSEVSSDV